MPSSKTYLFDCLCNQVFKSALGYPPRYSTFCTIVFQGPSREPPFIRVHIRKIRLTSSTVFSSLNNDTINSVSKFSITAHEIPDFVPYYSGVWNQLISNNRWDEQDDL